MWRIEFTSADFLPRLPQACQVNPGAYGFELAWWLAQALAARGIVTSYPLGEDWGWLIEHVDADETEFTIGCSSMAQVDEGYVGQASAWSIFIRPHTSLKQRLRGQSHEEKVQRLGQHVTAALGQAGIAVAR